MALQVLHSQEIAQPVTTKLVAEPLMTRHRHTHAVLTMNRVPEGSMASVWRCQSDQSGVFASLVSLVSSPVGPVWPDCLRVYPDECMTHELRRDSATRAPASKASPVSKMVVIPPLAAAPCTGCNPALVNPCTGGTHALVTPCPGGTSALVALPPLVADLLPKWHPCPGDHQPWWHPCTPES